MPFKDHGRQYDIVIFGATGYTGLLTVEHVATNFPPDLKWAIAGRSEDKLRNLVSRCKELNPTSRPPEIEVCPLEGQALDELSKKTFCLITAVGPYALYGELAFKACAENGTHYIDFTAEVPWVLEMINKYEKTAKANGAFMFPQCALESAPSDILTWTVVERLRRDLSSQTSNVIMSVHELPSIPSGGTLASLLGLFEKYSLKTLRESIQPYALSPVPNSHQAPKQSFLSSISGLHRIPGLGLLSTTATGAGNRAIVHRTWGLMKEDPSLQHEFYGPKFTYREFEKPRNFLTGIMMHYSLITGAYLLLLSPVRAALKKFVFKPGEGPDPEKTKNEHIEFRAVAQPDLGIKIEKQVFGKLLYDGSMYHLSAILVAQAARSLLQASSTPSTGGIYTPACLGQAYVDCLKSAGVKLDIEVQNI